MARKAAVKAKAVKTTTFITLGDEIEFWSGQQLTVGDVRTWLGEVEKSQVPDTATLDTDVYLAVRVDA